MANVSVSSQEKLANLSAGQLIDRIEGDLAASDAIAGGGGSGLIDSLDRRRDGTINDSIGPYSAGTDRMSNFAVNASFASGEGMAYKQRSIVQPDTLHILADVGNRYHGSLGTSLFTLARLTVATALITAEHARANMRTVIVSDSHEPLVIDDDGATPEAVYVLDAYDEYIAKLDEPSKKKRKSKKTAKSPLLEGLEILGDEDEFIGNREAVVLVSDLITGAIFNRDNELEGFDWERQLRHLAEGIDDRLYVARLTTPSQTELPFGYDFSSGSSRLSVDMAGYMELAERQHTLGTAKAKRISECLKLIRTSEVSSLDKVPLITITDFMFGKPPSED